MSEPRITRMTITFGGSKPRKTYGWGDTRMRGNTTYIKQPVMAYDYRTREPIGYQSRRGRILTEWVVKDGPRDRNSSNFKR